MASAAHDGFERYFAEKLWEMIPGVYRHEDGVAKSPGVLRALVEVMAEQAAIVRRSHDRVWDDQFVDLCDDWAVPYLADLVGTRLLSALNRRGRRIDVAKTVYYRRRKGTLGVIEEIVGDIAGWDGRVTEAFRRLGRSRHGLDPVPAGRLVGRHTRTAPGGWINMRSGRAGGLVGTPFDEAHYTPDVRRPRGRRGRLGIFKVPLHLYRRPVFRVDDVSPRPTGGGAGYTFDPSGREIPLHQARHRFPSDAAPVRTSDWAEWVSHEEWEMPGPMACRVVGHVEFEVTDQRLTAMQHQSTITASQADELRRLLGARYRNATDFDNALGAWSTVAPTDYASIRAACLVEDCGRRGLVPRSLSVHLDPDGPVPSHRLEAGDLTSWRSPPAGADVLVSPERGRFTLSNTGSVRGTSYHFGWPGALGARPADRQYADDETPDITWTGGAAGAVPTERILEVTDNRSYALPVNTSVSMTGDLVLRASNQRRPHVAIDTSLTFTADDDRNLTIEGLWLGGGDVILAGDFESVRLVDATLDPGGVDTDGRPIPRSNLVVSGTVERMTVTRSIVASVRVEGDGIVEHLIVRDAIVHGNEAMPAETSSRVGRIATRDTGGTETGLPATIGPGFRIGSTSPLLPELLARPVRPAVEAGILLPSCDVELVAVTVLGQIVARTLQATEALLTARPRIAHVQTGCFRFGAAPVGSSLPRPYRWFQFQMGAWTSFFASRTFGHAAYLRLSEAAPLGLREGAENGSEVGAFHSDLESIKLRGLRDKVAEYLPFGLLPIYVSET